jgi:YD repeat-containing protein
MKAKVLRVLLLMAIFIIPSQIGLNTVFAETINKTGIYNGFEYPDAHYKKGISPAFSVNKNQEEIIDPSSGRLEIYNTDLVLKGKNGLDLKIARYYDSSSANLKETLVYAESQTQTMSGFTAKGTCSVIMYEINQPTDIIKIEYVYYDTNVFNSEDNATLADIVNSYNNHEHDEEYDVGSTHYIKIYTDFTVASTYYTGDVYTYKTRASDSTSNDKYFNLGAGWAFDFPYVEKRGDGEYLHYGNSGVWQIKMTSDTTDSNLKGYLLKDIVINNDTSLTYSYNNSSWTSKYSVTEKDGKKIYIASDGLILGIDDRFGNKIRFAHTTHTVSDFNPLNGVIENNISYPLISRITDSLNRVVVFDYSSPDKVILTVSNDLDANDKKVITYNKKLANNTDAVSGIPTGQRGRLDSEYILDNVTENVNYTENRTVSYKYNIKYTKESLLTKNINHLNDPENQSFGGTYNYYACLSNIIYPTGGKTVYEYNPGIKYSGTDTSVNGFDGRDSSVDPVPDTVIKNCGTSGSMYYYRVTKRYELDGTEVINNKVYTYNKSGNNMYDGYPKYADSNNLPDTFKYTTDIVDSNGNKQTYTYNNKWLCEDLLDEASDHKFRTKYYYDKSKKLLLKKTIRKADKATGNFTVSNEDYEYDDYGNLTGYWDNQALRKYDSSKDEYIRYDPSKTEERSQYTFYPLGTWDSTYTTYTDTVKGKAISVNPDEFKTTFTYHPEYHYLTGKIYKKDENTTIREEYTPTSTETDNPVQVRNGKAIRFLKVFEKKDSGSEVLKKKTEYQYDQYGNVIKQIAYYTSTGNGDLNSSTLNVTTVFDYTDNKGRPAFNGAYLTKKSNSRILDTDGNLVEGRTSNLSGTIDELYYYDWFGNLVKVQDGNGFTKSYVYDKLWRLTKEVNDNDGGSYKQWDYKLDSTENSVTFTDENNTKISDVTKRHKTKTVYDVFGNKTYEKVYIEDENEQFSWVDKRKYTYYNDMKLDTVYDLVNNSNTKHEYYIDGRLKSKQTQEGDGTILFKESYVYLDATSDNLYSKVTKTILGGNNGASPQIVTSTYTDTSNMLRRQERPHYNDPRNLDRQTS